MYCLVLCALHAFLDFCYIAHQNFLTEHDLDQLKDAASCFHQYCEAFIDSGVWKDFLMPRQHSLMHYHALIQLFGAPNGLCSSITESKHIWAVKEPWCQSNCWKALSQMLVMNQWLDQLAAAWSDFSQCGMLNESCLSEILKACCMFLFCSYNVVCVDVFQLKHWLGILLMTWTLTLRLAWNKKMKIPVTTLLGSQMCLLK